MKLIVGLGNPEAKYRNNRHNVGHMVIDELLSNGRIKDVIAKKSDKYMNNSGSFVLSQYSKFLPAQAVDIPYSSLYVVHDDLDIPLGAFKIQFGKGPKDHNGLKSIDKELGTDKYWHVRVGVDNRDPENRIDGYDYVLEDFTNEEMKILENVLKQICNQLAN